MSVGTIPWLVLFVPLCGLTLVFLLGKCFFLAPFRVGWFMMAANLIYELLFKKLRWRREVIDAAALVVMALGWGLLSGGRVAVPVVTFAALMWGYTLLIDIRWRTGRMARQDSRYAGRVPLPIPRLIVTVRGPVLDRGRVHQLGDWPQGHQEHFDLLILNPSLVVPQLPLVVGITSTSEAIDLSYQPPADLKAPDPGDFVTVGFDLRAARAGRGGDLRVRVEHGDLVVEKTLRLKSVLPAGQAKPTGAEIRRWKGGARAAFGWRGDQDMYDPATFQSVDGLRAALGLSSRFRLPSTLYVSGRLSLVEDELRKFCEHFGWDRRPGEIPSFLRFLREEVHLECEMDFPLECDRPYFMELGNHMYLHLGTHAAADEGNRWKSHCWIGDGEYPWQGDRKDSFHEQLDNARKNIEVIEKALGFHVRSWGIPGRVFDEQTSRALEAAGVEVASDSDASAWRNVVELIPPHHPRGCEHLVEITKKYPGDPSNACKIAMLRYWAHANRRAGSTMLFMAHHHLLRYEGSSCYHLTEEFFRYVLGECHGDFYVATVTAMGMYWKRVLSPRTRCLEITCSEGTVTVTNKGQADLDRLPLEIDLGGGKRFMTLVDVPAGRQTAVEVG